MADDRQRWLRQQVELGGSEAILSGPLAAAPRAESPSSKVEARSPEAPETAGSPEVATAAIIGAVPKWLKDAPSIPGDGLVIEPGPWDFTEPRAQLESLEQVAAMVAGCTLCPLCRTRRNTV